MATSLTRTSILLPEIGGQGASLVMSAPCRLFYRVYRTNLLINCSTALQLSKVKTLRDVLNVLISKIFDVSNQLKPNNKIKVSAKMNNKNKYEK